MIFTSLTVSELERLAYQYPENAEIQKAYSDVLQENLDDAECQLALAEFELTGAGM